MVCLEGEDWWRHRRMINPALDQRALRPDLPSLIGLAEEMARHLADLPRGQPVEIGRTLDASARPHDRPGLRRRRPEIDAMVLRMGRYPEKYSVLDLLPLPRWLRFVDRWRSSRTGVEPLLRAARPAGRRARRSPDYAGSKDLLWRLAQHAGPAQTASR